MIQNDFEKNVTIKVHNLCLQIRQFFKAHWSSVWPSLSFLSLHVASEYTEPYYDLYLFLFKFIHKLLFSGKTRSVKPQLL